MKIVELVEKYFGTEGVEVYNREIFFPRFIKRLETATDRGNYSQEEIDNRIRLINVLKKEYEFRIEQYKMLCKLYGVESRTWDMIHCPTIWTLKYCFCKENRKGLISEYLTWEQFVEDAKEFKVHYYMHIDTFLEIYKKVVYERIKIED